MTEVSVVHASPDAGPVDVVVDGDTVFEGVEFGDGLGYAPFEPGVHELSLAVDGTTALGPVERSFRAGTRVTVHAVGNESPEFLDDDEEVEEAALGLVSTLDATSHGGPFST